MKKKILIGVFCIIATAFAFTEDIYSQPGRNDVVFVFSLKMKPELDRAFFEKYLNLKTGYMMASKNKYIKPEKKKDLLKIFISDEIYVTNDTYIDEEFISFLIRDVKTKGFNTMAICQRNLYGGNMSFVYPLFIKFSVPEKAQYIYLGEFECKRPGGFDYTANDVKHSYNKFDEAAKIIKERYGEKAELIRTRVQSLD